MSLVIQRVWVPSSEKWDSVWNDCPYSTYFHSREWAEIWEAYTEGRMTPTPIAIEFSDKKDAILPLSREKVLRGLLTRYYSSPAGTFGGWISPDPLGHSHKTLLIKLILKEYPDLIWRTNPYANNIELDSHIAGTEDETYALNLTVGYEKIYREWSKGQAGIARKARKAQKAGVQIVVADTLEDWQGYYKIYLNSLVRWGNNTTSSYSWNLFEKIYLCDSTNIKLWLAKYNGTTIAGALCFYSPTHVAYWHGSALAEYFGLRPVNLLLQEIICDAARRNLTWFDFNPSGKLEGVKNFKRSFGAIPLSSQVVTRSSLKTVALSKIAMLKIN